MKKRMVVEAYDAIQPDEMRYEDMRERLQEAAEQTPRRKGGTARRVLLLAACIALIAAVSSAGYAAYQKWSLPEPEPYETSDGSFYEVHSETDYTQEDLTQKDPEPLSDEALIAQAVELLHTVGRTDVSTEEMTVSRQTQAYWDREEAKVTFTQGDGTPAEVTFDADSGALLGFSGIAQWIEEPGQVCETEAQAEALVDKFYAMLPVPQGYVRQGKEAYDEQYWSYDFCREVAEGIYSYYECVRLAINPKTGQLSGCVVFDTPLLDDHEPGDVPLTQAEAEAIAEGIQDLERYTLKKAECTVVLPNWMYSEHNMIIDAKASEVTRLAWVLTYEDESSEFADIIEFHVDYYTGEVLGGNMT